MPFLQISRQARRTGGAIALADQKLWREPAVIARRVQPDKIPHRLNILAKLMPLLRLLSIGGATVTRADRVDEDQVRFIQERILIIRQLERRRRQLPFIGHHHPARTEDAQMQPDRRRARSTVERKRKWTFRQHGSPFRGLCRGAVPGIGDEEDLRPRLLSFPFLLTISRFLLKEHRAGCDGILDFLAADANLVLCYHEIIFERWLFFLL